MKTLVDRGRQQQRRLEADVADRMETLFQHWPALCGFSVQPAGEVTRDRRVCPLAAGLFLSDLACYPDIDLEEAQALCEEISTLLSALAEQQPEAAMVLRGRTFARTMH